MLVVRYRSRLTVDGYNGYLVIYICIFRLMDLSVTFIYMYRTYQMRGLFKMRGLNLNPWI